MLKTYKKELATITDTNRPHIIEWLRDRSAFHSWCSSIVTASFVVVTVFSKKSNTATLGDGALIAALTFMLFALLCNLICVWSIPSWKYRVNTGLVNSAHMMRLELAITAWLGVISFVSGLTLAMIGSIFP